MKTHLNKLCIALALAFAWGLIVSDRSFAQINSAPAGQGQNSEKEHSAAREAVEQTEEKLLGTKQHEALEIKENTFHVFLGEYKGLLGIGVVLMGYIAWYIFRKKK